MLERFVTFKKSNKPVDHEWLKVGKKPLVFTFLIPLVYGIIIVHLAMEHLPGGFGNIPDDRSEETYAAMRRYIFFLPLTGFPLLPMALRGCPSPSEKATFIKVYLAYGFLIMAVCIAWLYFMVPFMPRF